MIEKEMQALKSLQAAYEKVRFCSPTSMIRQLVLPPLPTWNSEQLDEASREQMAELARANSIEVMPLDPRHAPRAWQRYFDVEMPFNREEERMQRRLDIPDSWIFEAAIELYQQKEVLVALSGDAKLRRCFDSIDVPAYNKAGDLLRVLEAEDNAQVEPEAAQAQAQPLDALDDGSELRKLMASAQTRSLQAERTILGVVGYLTTVPKTELIAMMASIGLDEPIVRNAAERLALHGLVRDIGSAYIPRNRQACELAAAEIEPLIVQLVTL